MCVFCDNSEFGHVPLMTGPNDYVEIVNMVDGKFVLYHNRVEANIKSIVPIMDLIYCPLCGQKIRKPYPSSYDED